MIPGPNGPSFVVPGEEPRDCNLPPAKRPKLAIFRSKYED